MELAAALIRAELLIYHLSAVALPDCRNKLPGCLGKIPFYLLMTVRFCLLDESLLVDVVVNGTKGFSTTLEGQRWLEKNAGFYVPKPPPQNQVVIE